MSVDSQSTAGMRRRERFSLRQFVFASLTTLINGTDAEKKNLRVAELEVHTSVTGLTTQYHKFIGAF
jgi:hypothetical protein